MVEEILSQPSLETRTCHKRDTRRSLTGWNINVTNLPDPAYKIIHPVFGQIFEVLSMFWVHFWALAVNKTDILPSQLLHFLWGSDDK